MIEVEDDWSWVRLQLRLIEVKVNLYHNLWNVFAVYSCRLITFILYDCLFSDFLIFWSWGVILCSRGLFFLAWGRVWVFFGSRNNHLEAGSSQNIPTLHKLRILISKYLKESQQSSIHTIRKCNTDISTTEWF